MASIKNLRIRIKSVKATQKITSAMKMVAAAKLRKAQSRVDASRPYERAMRDMLAQCSLDRIDLENCPTLLTGVPDGNIHLLIVATSDRGLCGGFNGSIVREARAQIKRLEKEGKEVRLLCLGRKGRDQLRRDHKEKIVETITDLAKSPAPLEEAIRIFDFIHGFMLDHPVCSVSIVFSVFRSALTQEVSHQLMIPVEPPVLEEGILHPAYEYEPDIDHLLGVLLERYLTIHLYQAILETTASEYGARMTAMDHATRNARDVIKRLELHYNRTRQAGITKELIEIISGAEAL